VGWATRDGEAASAAGRGDAPEAPGAGAAVSAPADAAVHHDGTVNGAVASASAVAALNVHIKALQAEVAAANARAAAAEARLVSVTSSYETQLGALRAELMRLQGPHALSGVGTGHMYIGPPGASPSFTGDVTVPPPVAVTPPRSATDIALAIATGSPPAALTPPPGASPFGHAATDGGAANGQGGDGSAGKPQSLSREVERLRRSVAQARAALGTPPEATA